MATTMIIISLKLKIRILALNLKLLLFKVLTQQLILLVTQNFYHDMGL